MWQHGVQKTYLVPISVFWLIATSLGIILVSAGVGHFWAWMAPSAQIDPQIQRSNSTLFIKKKMGVTPLACNQAGKGVMALLGA